MKKRKYTPRKKKTIKKRGGEGVNSGVKKDNEKSVLLKKGGREIILLVYSHTGQLN